MKTTNEFSFTDQQIMALDAVAAAACKPGCECSKNEGMMCYDRWERRSTLMETARSIARMARLSQNGSKLDFSDANNTDLAVVVNGMAQVHEIESPMVSRMDILLKNKSARAVRLARLWLDSKLSFDAMFETVLPRK